MNQEKIKKIKITYILPSLDRGGAERFFVDLIKNLNKDTFEPSLLLYKRSGDWQKELDSLGVKVVLLEKKRRFDILNFWKMYKSLKSLRPDIVHTQLGADIYGVLAAKLAGVEKIISTEVNINLKETKLYNYIKTFSLKFSDKIIAVSEAVKLDASKRYGYKEEKVVVIYNGIEIKNFPLLALKTLSERSEKSGKINCIFGTIGRLEEQKGHKYLINAFKDSGLKDSRLIIAGQGSLRWSLESLIARLKLKSRVELRGAVVASEFFKEIDVFVFPSLWEGMGIVLVEAALSGRPVIFSDVPGANEVLNKDIAWPLKAKSFTSLSAEMVNIKNNYNSPAVALKILKARESVCSRFDIKLIAQEHQVLYLSLLKK